MQSLKLTTVVSTIATLAMGLLATPALADTTELSTNEKRSPVLKSVDTHSLIPLDTPELVEAYEYALKYVQESRAAWDARFDKSYWASHSEELATKYEAAQHDLQVKRQLAEEAQAKYEESRQRLAAWVRYDHQNTTGFKLPVGAEAFMGGANSMRQMQNEHTARETLAQSRANDIAQAEADKKAATDALNAVEAQTSLLQQMSSNSEELSINSEKANEEVTTSLNDARLAWSNTYRVLNTSDTTLGPSLVQRAVVEEWNSYLDELAALDIDIPTQEELSHSTSYPDGLSPVPALNITNSLGVAEYQGVIVPTQESILRTSQALSHLGRPYAPLGDGTTAWGCLPFTQEILQSDAGMDDMYHNSGRQNKSILDTQVGDIVFMSDPNAGIHQAGLFVFGGFVISASAPAGQVTVSTVGVDALNSIRPGLKPINNLKAPEPTDKALNWHCGGIEGEIQETTEGWTLPVTSEYEIGAEFNDIGERFSDANFTGTEFITAEEETVHSIFKGTVESIENDPEWGLTVTIAHSENLESRYSLLGATTVTEGQEVASGTIIGTTGNSGNIAMYKHAVILFMKTLSGYTDPIGALLTPLQGQYQNGQIPTEALCRITVSNGLLRCDAARAFEVLAEAYRNDFGESIQLTDTYRTLEGQIRCTAQKGNMCARPGTSNHGWGLAIDFSGGINSFNTPQHKWMRENAPKFGWHLPAWARADGSKPEPWHWEYEPLS